MRKKILESQREEWFSFSSLLEGKVRWRGEDAFSAFW
jgi:hypothetical protein